MRRALAPFLGLVLLLGSCGGSADPAALASAGETALASRDHSAALADFQAALKAIGSDTSHPQYKRSMMGAIEANAKLAPEQAVKDFMALAGSDPTIKDAQYSLVGGWLASNQHYLEAITVMDAGLKAHADSTSLMTLKKSITVAAEKSGDNAALDKLKGLGYL